MTRNTNSRFALNPTRLDMSRSRFDRSASYKTTFNVGDLVPFYVDEVLPGDTFSVDTSKVVRMQTLMTPIMDNIYLDFYFFFVPNRIVWSHWRELMGENSQSAWIPTVEYSVPQVTSPVSTGWQVGTIADYMGIPTGVPNLSVNALPMRGYALICNEWFRDENLTDPLNVPVTDSDTAGSNGSNYITDVVAGGKPFRVAKYHDYFTSCLPSPQKGPDVTISVANEGMLPVYTTGDYVPVDAFQASRGIQFATKDGSAPSTNSTLTMWNNTSGGKPYATAELGSYSGEPSGTSNFKALFPANLWALNDGTAAVATINQLRTAFQIQKLYERDARGGTRYIEILKSHFGVTSPDARLQRPEYLGGSRIPININQVVQQSETQSTPQGNTAAYSLTVDSHSDFTKSFVEHGFVIGVMCARYDHSYQQGLERFWSRKDRFDYYWPVFANLGEMAVLNKEIYAQGTDKDNEVFGYQEAWADYRYRPSRVTGEMRSQYAQSLDVWHLADDYDKLPSLSDSWIREDPSTVNRVIAVSDQVSNQLFCDIYIRCSCTRPMPLYSIPGLVDHH
ncbi:major capsid protein [Sigmofec virus UA08Rod_5692]|uniref:Major capsid protein n=1 Tax=Sigmofec virus UA08Rod_5692 TaxID=2929436 RepID=A0A976R6X0_9VIRU|nr:major capsid protein [Sigmofec virus UA08Rod_5692]